MNKPENKPDIIYDDGTFKVRVSAYTADDSMALVVLSPTGIYAYLTVNLFDYGMFPKPGWIFLDHKVDPNEYPYNMILKKIGYPGLMREIAYGYARSYEIMLKPDVEKKANRALAMILDYFRGGEDEELEA